MIRPIILTLGTALLSACIPAGSPEEASTNNQQAGANDGDGNLGNHGGIENVSMAPDMLKKTAFYFSSTLPSQQELNGLTGSQYSAKVQAMMNSPEFEQQMVNIFEDRLMTDKYIAANDRDGAIDLLNGNDYPNKKWYEDEFDGQSSIMNCARNLTNDALSNASIELIRYTIHNDLPISNMLTADYMMVNYYSQKALDAEIIGNADFKQLDQPVCVQTDSGEIVNSLAFDPMDFRPARVVHDQQRFKQPVAHAGLLSDIVFLNRYPTTDTNINRHRARIVMDYFLDFDILSIDKDRTIDANDSVNSIPTLENPNCTICHNMLDPIASTFRDRNSTGRIIPAALNRGDNPWNFDEILAPGYLGKDAESEGVEDENLIPWLAQQIVADVRFPRAITKTLYAGLYGHQPNRTLLDEQDYLAYETLVEKAKQALINDDMNIKSAVKVLVEDELWANAQQKNATSSKRKRRLVTPEILNKKLQLLTGVKWDDIDTKSREIMFGGVDSDSVTERLEDPNGIYLKMQMRMAVETACKSVANDFAYPLSERKLFPLVDVSTSPLTLDGEFDATASVAIKQNIQYLHTHLLNEELSLNDAELLQTYQLFITTQQDGLARLANPDDYSPTPMQNLHPACQVPSTHSALTSMIGDSSIVKELRSVRYPERCLTYKDDSLNMSACDSGNEQKWITQNGRIKSGVNSNQCLTASELANGARFSLATCDAENPLQDWSVEGAQLRNGVFSLDVSGNSASTVHVWKSHGGTNQIWSVDGKDIRTDLNRDEQYTLRSWMAVITYLLSDALFIFE